MRYVTGSLLLVVLLLWIGLSAPAQEMAAAPGPSPHRAVPSELIFGTLGGAVFGAGGFLIALSSCVSQIPTNSGFGGIGAALACTLVGVLVYAVSVPAGAIIGVNLTGRLSGVRGNFWLSLLGGVGGNLGGIAIGSLIGNAVGNVPTSVSLLLVLGVVPFASSAGATLGYNVGATMRTPSTGYTAMRLAYAGPIRPVP